MLLKRAHALAKDDTPCAAINGEEKKGKKRLCRLVKKRAKKERWKKRRRRKMQVIKTGAFGHCC